MATQYASEIESLARAAARADRVKALAAEVERSAGGAAGLCSPIEADWLNEHVSDPARCLFALRWFNPFGPTHLEFVLKPVPGRDAVLLFAGQRHPFAPQAWALGLLASDQCDSEVELLAVFSEFALREQGRASALVKSSPTLVLRPTGGPLGWDALKQIVRALLGALNGQELEQAIAHMRRFPGRPWDRTAAELEATFARFAPHLDPNAAPPEPPQHAPVTEELFDAWWACVTDPTHAGAEMAEFPRAWDGAIRFHRGEFSRRATAQEAGDQTRGVGGSLIDDEEVV